MSENNTSRNNDLLWAGEVANMFRVSPKTVTRWGNEGRLTTIRTPGGHRRFSRTEVERILNNNNE